MVGREQLGKMQGRPLSGREVFRVSGPLQRADRILVKTVVDSALITHRDATSALVEKRDAPPYQFEKSGRQGPVRAQRGAQATERFGHCRKATNNGGNAEIDPISLTEVLCRHRGEGSRRRDSGQFIVSCIRNDLSGSPEVSPSRAYLAIVVAPSMIARHLLLSVPAKSALGNAHGGSATPLCRKTPGRWLRHSDVSPTYAHLPAWG